MPTANEIRQQFIDFFCKKHGHTFVPSSSVVPLDDPTLLFTNAGMNQFKPYFLGTEKPLYPRAANTQKCIRAGGKHNDLDDVGKDTYHHTFFEMLGNWSFGDYFKKEAIAWAWELLTDVWKLDKARLHVTVFEGDESAKIPRDDEAVGYWRAVGVADDHIHLGNKKDNFWEMGDTGPCGPCTEIHYDNTKDLSGAKLVNKGTADVIEIWNLVFIQFNRNPDKTLTPLPAKHVDTGMGFERITKVLQAKDSNYDTDVFTPIINAIETLTGEKYGGKLDDLNDVAFRVIADHLRMLVFAITDGGLPSNKGRGAVIRSVLRRAVRFGYQRFSQRQPFLFRLVPVVLLQMGNAFPELTRDPARVVEIIKEEESEFFRTVDRGMSAFFQSVESSLEQAIAAAEKANPSSLGAVQKALQGLRDPIEADRSGLKAVARALTEASEGMRKAVNPHIEIQDRLTEAFQRAQSALNPVVGVHTAASEALQRAQEALNPKIDINRAVLAKVQAALTSALHPKMDMWNAAFQALQDALKPATNVNIAAMKAAQDAIQPYMQLSRIVSESLRQSNLQAPALPGSDVFQLHTTLGFPPDLTRQISAEFEIGVDEEGYRKLIKEHEEKSRAGEKKHVITAVQGDLPTTDDSPKYGPLATTAVVTAWVKDNTIESGCVWAGGRVGLVLDRTNFYAEQGGQVGDTGWIKTDTGSFEVEDTQRLGDSVIHRGKVFEGTIKTGQTATLEVSLARLDTMRNHTATHLLNWALRQVLGDHVEQKGSLVDAEHTRFDFTHDKPMTHDEFAEVERLVNAKILADQPVTPITMPLADAKKIAGVRAVFGEKYPDPVRVLLIGAEKPEAATIENSVEFCGGTHLSRTSQACLFKIVGQEGVAKGVRRITAVTGPRAVAHVQKLDAIVGEISERFHCRPEELPTRITTLQEEIKKVQHQLKKGAASDLAGTFHKLLGSAVKVGDASVLIGEIPAGPDDAIRTQVDRVKQKAGSCVVVVGWTDEDKVGLLAAVSDDLVKKGIKAGDLIKQIAPIVGGGGGGRPNMAQAGGKDPAKLGEALAKAKQIVAALLVK